ncbi:MAG: HDOD domain-containing protein, partial [Gammaproteobacteria bacterium]|nr:HDOD domain-containing protein [Gammaproteobacteria bacterium]
LTLRLLKVVNSPLYGFPSKIDTISMAITILGTRQLRDLVLATTIVNRFQSLTNDVVNMETFWCHSICSAIAARALSTELKSNNIERFFVAGLLHDIGKLVMFLGYPDASKQVIELAADNVVDTSSLEKSIFGFTHGDVGAELLRQWNLPESLVEPVHYHHHPIRATHYKTETAVVHIADGIANDLQTPISCDDDHPVLEIAWTMLGLKPDIMDRLHETVYEQLDPSLQLLYYEQVA